jgi:hypothetical protein
MARISAKQPIFATSVASRELERLSKAALMDIVVDCCKRMFGEDVYEANQNACLNEVCQVVLRHRGDKNPWEHSSGTAQIGAAFDEKPYHRI